MNTKKAKSTALISLTIFLSIASSLFFQKSSAAESKRVLTSPVEVGSSFGPCGWMGDAEAGTKHVQLEPSFNDGSRPNDNDDTIIKISYQPGSKNWAGVYWLYPASENVCNWGQKPATEIIGAAKIVFWIRGDKGGEKVEIKAGDVRSKLYKDSFDASLGKLTLTNNWEKKEIDLTGKNLETVVGAFAWIVANPEPSGLTFYLDGIRFE